MRLVASRRSRSTSRATGKAPRSDPKATRFILDPANPQRWLEIRADVALEAGAVALIDRGQRCSPAALVVAVIGSARDR